MPPDPSAPAKLCPRCGAFYQDLRSQTCPQCFARLEILDKDTANRLSQEQAARIFEPAFLEAKAVADERFKEQSFGACLAIAGIVLATLVVSVVFIWLAATREHLRPVAAVPAAALSAPQPLASTLLPPILGGFARRGIENEGNMPGKGIPLYRGIYRGGIQVYAAPIAGGQNQQEALHLAATLAAQQHNPPLLLQEITTAKAHYAILGPSRPDVARVASAISTENTTP